MTRSDHCLSSFASNWLSTSGGELFFSGSMHEWMEVTNASPLFLPIHYQLQMVSCVLCVHVWLEVTNAFPFLSIISTTGCGLCFVCACMIGSYQPLSFFLINIIYSFRRWVVLVHGCIIIWLEVKNEFPLSKSLQKVSCLQQESALAWFLVYVQCDCCLLQEVSVVPRVEDVREGRHPVSVSSMQEVSLVPRVEDVREGRHPVIHKRHCCTT